MEYTIKTFLTLVGGVVFNVAAALTAMFILLCGWAGLTAIVRWVESKRSHKPNPADQIEYDVEVVCGGLPVTPAERREMVMQYMKIMEFDEETKQAFFSTMAKETGDFTRTPTK